jgi:DNA-directed RNA polymerase III subunit RPC11
LIESQDFGQRFKCQTCPYAYELVRAYTTEVALKKKERDELLGGADAWENVDRTTARCPQCSHDEAYFMQIQIRSADEPMTNFFKCVKCGIRWND